MEKILISSRTTAFTTTMEHVNPPGFYPEVPVTIWCWGLQGSEVIEIQFRTDLPAPNDWVTVHRLTATFNQTGIYAPCRFKIKKGVTVGNAGVAMSKVRGLD